MASVLGKASLLAHSLVVFVVLRDYELIGLVIGVHRIANRVFVWLFLLNHLNRSGMREFGTFMLHCRVLKLCLGQLLRSEWNSKALIVFRQHELTHLQLKQVHLPTVNVIGG